MTEQTVSSLIINQRTFILEQIEEAVTVASAQGVMLNNQMTHASTLVMPAVNAWLKNS